MKFLLVIGSICVGILIGNNMSVAIDLIRPKPEDLIMTSLGSRAFGYNRITDTWIAIRVDQQGRVICGKD